MENELFPRTLFNYLVGPTNLLQPVVKQQKYPKAIGSTPFRSTRIFFPNVPESPSKNHISAVAGRNYIDKPEKGKCEPGNWSSSSWADKQVLVDTEAALGSGDAGGDDVDDDVDPESPLVALPLWLNCTGISLLHFWSTEFKSPWLRLALPFCFNPST